METKDHDNISNKTHKIDEVERFLRILHPDGEGFEIRYIRDKRAIPAVFDSPQEAAAFIEQIDATGIYVTLNPVAEEIGGAGASDVDITRRHWLLVDCDPQRETGTNATRAELDGALELRGQVETYLNGLGFPEPVKVLSGNGGHLLYRVDLEPETDLVKRFLYALGKKFSTEKVKIDRTVANASRITKVAGTLTKKGEHTAERPQRHAHLENPDIKPEIVPVELLEKVAADIPETEGAVHAGAEPRPDLPLRVLQPIEDGCAFMQHCREDAATLVEPEWFAMTSILIRCQDGERLVHEWSSPYPHYTWDETQRKLERALEDGGPRTCENIRVELGFEGCETCPHNGQITSPISLGPPKFYVRNNGIMMHKEGDDPDLTLTDFTAVISRDLKLDNGADVERAYEITANVRGRQQVIQVPADKFEKMGWVCEQLGAKAVISSGHGNKDRVREAIQTMSQHECVDETVYTHTGWRQIDGRWVYLHGGGAIGSEGNLSDVTTMLHGSLARYRLELPEHAEAEREAIRASLRILELGPDTITFPLLAATYRAAMGKVGASVHLVGATGVFKTQLAALCQQHYGAEMIGTNLPGSWSSTANSIEVQGFLTKDALFVIDDFKPTGSKGQVDAMHKDAERVLRAFANGQGRDRLNRDATLKEPRPPRTMALSTGEDTPRGESLRARCLIIQIEKDTIAPSRLKRCQRDASSGLYVRSMGGFLLWVADQYDEIQEQLEIKRLELRDELLAGQHRRTPDILASMITGFDLFLRYAVKVGAIDQQEAELLRIRCRDALIELGEEQLQEQLEFNAATRFCELLNSAISSGQAHLGGENNGRPPNELALGWERSGTGGFHSRGDCVGWIIEGDLYINLDAAMKVVCRVAVDHEGVNLNTNTMSKRLFEAGMLSSSDIEVEGRKTYKVRRAVNGKTETVLHLKTEVLGLDQTMLEQWQQPRGVAGQIWAQG